MSTMYCVLDCFYAFLVDSLSSYLSNLRTDYGRFLGSSPALYSPVNIIACYSVSQFRDILFQFNGYIKAGLYGQPCTVSGDSCER